MIPSTRRNLLLVPAAVFFFLFVQQLAAQPQQVYPRMAGYVGILHPLVSYSSDKPHYNFDGSYTIGFPVGLNLWKSGKVGFSAEFVPFIRAGQGVSKMNNFLFHPGALFALGKGWTLATRAAFETGGRYGFTPVLNKIVARSTGYNWYVAVPVPARFGNSQPASLGLGLQFGIVF